jgi:nucleotide-binding universal stress UspA family protein
MIFKNILVPYDGSTYANRAFNTAIEIAKQHNSNLKVVACLDIADLGILRIDRRIHRDIMKMAEKQTKELFSKLDDTAKKNSIPIDSKIIESSNPVKSLTSFAKSKNIDLIVIGSSGRGKFDKVLLGSVSNGVMQKAKCPVMIIK